MTRLKFRKAHAENKKKIRDINIIRDELEPQKIIAIGIKKGLNIH